MRINREEIFGPVASVIKARDYDDALASPTTPSSACRRHHHDDLKHATNFGATPRPA